MRKGMKVEVVAEGNGVLRSRRGQPNYKSRNDGDVCFLLRVTPAMAKLPKTYDVANLMKSKARWLHVFGCVSCFDGKLHRPGGLIVAN